jgi:hypothetical protein
MGSCLNSERFRPALAALLLSILDRGPKGAL